MTLYRGIQTLLSVFILTGAALPVAQATEPFKRADYRAKFSWSVSPRVSFQAPVAPHQGRERVKKVSYFRDTAKGCPAPIMATMPQTSYQMGDLQGSGDSDEQPVHTVRFDYRFAVGAYEVTFAEYDCFAQATARDLPNDQGWGRADRPVINVSWYDALAYTKWLEIHTGQPYRLLSEAEWEFAARAGTDTDFFWGNTLLGENRAVCAGCGSPWDIKSTAPSGSFLPNEYGLYDMHGNVWEWVYDIYHANYKEAPVDGSPWLTPAIKPGVKNTLTESRVTRGGGFKYIPKDIRVSYRYRLNPNFKLPEFGFRVALTLD